jgi:hypothetical protein
MTTVEFLTPKEVAEELRIQHLAVLRLIQSGKLTASDVNTVPQRTGIRHRPTYRIRRSDLESFIAASLVPKPPKPVKVDGRRRENKKPWYRGDQPKAYV